MELTLELLSQMKEGEIFRTVTTRFQTFHEPGLATLTFVCVKGGNNDWAIYAGDENWPVWMIRNNGDKVTGKDLIKSLCPCNDEAFNRYRY